MKLNIRQFSALLIGLFIFQSCLDDPTIPDEIFNARAPVVETSSVESYSSTNITVSGVVLQDNGAEVTEKGICWSTSSQDSTNNKKVPAGAGLGSFTVEVKGFSVDTIYYLRAYAINAKGMAYGQERTVYIALPIVENTIVADIKDGKAKVGGTVVDMGYSEVIARGICWSLSNDPISNDPTIQDNVLNFTPGIGVFTGYLEKLIPEKIYNVRAFATNSIGTSYGSKVTFTTPKAFTVMADFENTLLSGAAAFSALNRAYFVGGDEGRLYTNNVLEFDPISNFWRPRLDYPLGGRKFMTAFSTDQSAYLLGGLVNPGVPTTEFYKFKVILNEWVALPPFPGTARWSAKATVQSKGAVTYGYVIGGRTTNAILNEVWRYNTIQEEWLQIENFPISQYGGIVLSKNDTIFAGLGQTSESTSTKTLWISSGDISTWKEETEIPKLAGTISSGAILNDCLYVIDSNNRIWEYNIKQKVWTLKNTLEGPLNGGHSMLMLNSSIYIGMSFYSPLMIKYDPAWDN